MTSDTITREATTTVSEKGLSNQVGFFDNIRYRYNKFVVLKSLLSNYLTLKKPESFHDLLKHSVARYPKKRAVCIGDQIMTFQELEDNSNQVADALLKYLCETIKNVDNPNDFVISVCANNSFNYCEVFFGALKAGIPLVPLNPLYNVKELEALLLKTKSVILFVDESLKKNVESVVANGNLSDTLKAIVYFSSTNHDNNKNNNNNNSSNGIITMSYEEFKIMTDQIKKNVTHLLAVNNKHINEDSVCYCACTSGTTSLPKVACYTLKSLLDKITPSRPTFTLPGTDVFLIGNFAGSLQPGTFLNAVFFGACVHFVDSQSTVPAFEQACTKYTDVTKFQFDYLILFGDQTKYLIDKHKENPATFQNFKPKFLLYGGCKFPVSMIQELVDIFPSTLVIQMYGSTEIGLVAMLAPDDHRYKSNAFLQGSSGKLAISKDKIRLVDVETREIIKEYNKPGEIQVNETMATKYLNDPEKTYKAFVEQDGYFSPGDLGMIDENGYVYVVDRISDMITLPNARNVYTTEIENVIGKHVKVKETVAYGIPDTENGIGDKCCAAIILNNGYYSKKEEDAIKNKVWNMSQLCQQLLSKNTTDEELKEQKEDIDKSCPDILVSIIEHCVNNLSSYKIPQELIILDDFPRNNNFKILKREVPKLHIGMNTK
jgi:acyl-CoA synthetase (AMP-forming)/AMP-acid ligase II